MASYRRVRTLYLYRVISITFMLTTYFFSTCAAAKGTEPHFLLLQLEGTYNSHTAPDITLQVNTRTLLELSAISEITQSGKVIDRQRIDTEHQVTTKNTYEKRLIKVRSPHEQPLPKGVYAQRIDIRILDSELDVPIIQSLTRFFSVSDAGIKEISSTKYSNIIEPSFWVADEFGEKQLEQDGSRDSFKMDLPEKLQFDRQEPIEERYQARLKEQTGHKTETDER